MGDHKLLTRIKALVRRFYLILDWIDLLDSTSVIIGNRYVALGSAGLGSYAEDSNCVDGRGADASPSFDESSNATPWVAGSNVHV